jgi:mono/diheme cytochrome c family protein
MRESKVILVVVLFLTTVLFGRELWSAKKEKTGSPENGRILYNKLKCSHCHRIGDVGGNVGPDLTKEGNRKRGIEWQVKNLIDSASTHPKHPNPYMPKFDKMTDKMLLDLATYLESLK